MKPKSTCLMFLGRVPKITKVARDNSSTTIGHLDRVTRGVVCLLLWCGLVTWGVVSSWAATTYVILTDQEIPSDGYMRAIGAVNGFETPGFVFLGRAPGSINGTPVRFGWIANSIAYFGIAGDLNLAAGDQILGTGSNFLHLE